LNFATLIDDNIGSGAKQVALDQGSLGVQLVPPLLILCASAARARGRTLKSLNQFAPDWIAGQLCLFLSELSPLGPYRVASALASITADVRAAAS
jgi:hypothetical protein